MLVSIFPITTILAKIGLCRFKNFSCNQIGKLTTFRTPDLQLMATQNFKGRTKTHDMIGPQRGLNLKDIFHMIKRWYLMNCKGPICMRNHTLIWGLRRKRRVTPDHFSFGSSILCLHLKSLKNISSLLN